MRAPARRRRRKAMPGASSRSCRNRPRTGGLYVELFDFARPLHDEAEARAHVLAEQVVDGLLGDQRCLLRNGHAQRHATAWIERRGFQLVRGHLAQALEAHDVGLGVALSMLLEDAIAVGVVERPPDVFADLDLVERRLREKD